MESVRMLLEEPHYVTKSERRCVARGVQFSKDE